MSQLNLTNPEDVATLMQSSRSEFQWNENCDRVKEANGGYPGWWYETIVLSGIAGTAKARWKAL